MKNFQGFDIILFDDNYNLPLKFPSPTIEDINDSEITENDIIGTFMQCKTEEDIQATISVLSSKGIYFNNGLIKAISDDKIIDSENVIVINNSFGNKYCKISGMENPNGNPIEIKGKSFNYIQYGGEVDLNKTLSSRQFFKDYSITFNKDNENNENNENHQISIILGMFKENNQMGFYEISGRSYDYEQDFLDSDTLMFQLRNHYEYEMDTNALYVITNAAKEIFDVRTVREISSDILKVRDNQLKINMNDFKHLNRSNNKDRTQSDFRDVQLIVMDDFFLDRIDVSIIDYENDNEKIMKAYDCGASVIRLTNGHVNYWSFKYYNDLDMIRSLDVFEHVGKSLKENNAPRLKFFDIFRKESLSNSKENIKILTVANEKADVNLTDLSDKEVEHTNNKSEENNSESDIKYINDVFSELENIRKKLSKQGLNFKFTIDNN